MNPLTSRQASRRPVATLAAFLVALAASLSIVPAAQAVPHAEIALTLDHTSLSTGDVVGGTVTSLDGQPISAGEFDAALVTTDESRTFGTAPVAADGRFTLDVVPTAGVHTVAIRFSGGSRTMVGAPVTFDDTPWTPELTVDVDDVLVGQETAARVQVDLKGHPTVGELEVYLGGTTRWLPLGGDLTARSAPMTHIGNYAANVSLPAKGARQEAIRYTDFFVSRWSSNTTLNKPGYTYVRDVVDLAPVNDRGRTDFTYDLTTPEVCTLTGSVLTMIAAGVCEGEVLLADTDTERAENAHFSIPVNRIPTWVEVTTTPTDLMKGSEVVLEASASIHDSTDVPAGTFTLTRGDDETTLPAVNGRATFRFVASTPGEIEHVVTFTPDDDALATSTRSVLLAIDDPAHHVPQITATVTSTAPRTASGWYRTPATVTFRCTSPMVALATACPAPVTLRHGRHAGITRTVTTLAGRSATVVVPTINVDLKAPNVRLAGIGKLTTTAHLDAPKKPTCVSSDATSGVAKCTVATSVKGDTVTWTATAVDRSGNTRTATASVKLVKARIKGAKVVKGVAQAKIGTTHTLEVRSAKRPVLKGSTFTKVNRNTWSTKVRFTTKQAGRTVTFKPKAGTKTRTVKVKVIR